MMQIQALQNNQNDTAFKYQNIGGQMSFRILSIYNLNKDLRARNVL